MLGLHVPQVSDNGARLIDPVSGRTISSVTMAVDDARSIVQGLEADDLRYFAVDSGRIARSTSMFTNWNVTVITCAVPGRDISERMSREHSMNGVVAIASRGSRDEWYVNFTHSDAHKGSGAAQFASSVDAELSDVMAIGDGLNDVEMFSAVGIPVAMGHAPDVVKQLASHVTGTLEQDGVAQAIEKLVLD